MCPSVSFSLAHYFSYIISFLLSLSHSRLPRRDVSLPRALLGFGDGVLEIDENETRELSLNMQRTAGNPLHAGMTTTPGE